METREHTSPDIRSGDADPCQWLALRIAIVQLNLLRAVVDDIAGGRKENDVISS